MSDSVGSRDIIERLRDEAWLNIELVGPAPLARRFGGGAVRLADAEAAVRAAADTRTREIIEALLKDDDGRFLTAIDACMATSIPHQDLNAAVDEIADEVARRFPVSDCDTTRNEPPHGEGPAHEPGGRS